MTSSDRELRKAAFVGFFVGTSVLLMSLLWTESTALGIDMWKRYVLSFFGCGFGGLFLIWIATIIGLVPKQVALAQVAPPTQNCNGNCSFGQQGGTIIQNYNAAPQRLEYSDDLAAALLSKLTPQKPVIFKIVGGATDQQIGMHYANYLSAHGVQVKVWSIGILIPPPDQKVTFSDLGDTYQIIIAPNAS